MGRWLSPRAAYALPFLLLFSGACTTLGPTPAMSGLPTPPLERPGFELQAGIVPGYYLSTTVREDHESAGIPQLAGIFEPDELIHVPGLFVGARYAGSESEGAAPEPMVGYRTFLDADQRFSVSGLGFFAYATADEQAASFSALRGGIEAGADMRVTPVSKILELHLNIGATITGLDANGRYCVGVDGHFGVDCSDLPEDRMRIAASAGGLYPSGHAGLSLDFARHLRSPFHGGRLALDLAGGTMPTVVSGHQDSADWYGAAGVSVTVGLGATGRSQKP